VGIPVNLRGERRFEPDPDEVTFTFYDSGHILGAVGIFLEYQGQRVLFSGDVQFEDQEICRAAGLPETGVDVLIIETTRGAAPREEHYTREAEQERLAAAIRRVFKRNGAVLLPLFALGRTQELLTLLHDLIAEGRIPSCPIYIGGLSSKLTMLYDRVGGAAPRHRPNFKLVQEVKPQVVGGRQIHRFRPRPGNIYGISSGMMSEHTLSNLFAKYILPNPDHGLFFVGYSDPESPAGKIRAAKRGDTIKLHKNARPVVLECEVREFDFSAHAPRKQLLDYILRVNAPKTVLVHGDRPALEWFQEALSDNGAEGEVIVPRPGQPVDLRPTPKS
jgi:Cft2 family RNA processing exonuclease